MAEESVFILSGARSPIGSFNGIYQFTPTKYIGSCSMAQALKKSGLKNTDIDEVIIGQVFAAGQGQNVARQTAVLADIPFSVPAYTINMMCGSGLKSIYLAYMAIKSGEARAIICGGQENMSRAEHSVLVRDTKMANFEMKDNILVDGLTCAFESMHMGETAEYLARKYEISRKRQDEFAAKSQNKAEEAIKAGHFDKEIAPVRSDKTREVVLKDEYPRFGTTLDKLLNLKPCFIKKEAPGTVTPGNASGVNDGAATLVVCSGSLLREKNLAPAAKIIGFAQVGCAPKEMGLAPIAAVEKLLAKVGWTKEEVDLYELNEAFAVQADLVIQHLGVPIEKVNISGGSIALGHPLGATGARIVVTLMHNLRRLGLTKGVAALCVGGGMGISIAIEAFPEASTSAGDSDMA